MKLSNEQVDKKLIGEIVYGGLAAYKMSKIKRVLLNGKIEIIQLPILSRGVSLIALPNGNLVYGTVKKVLLLNENFQEIKSVETGGFSFCALNRRNEICVSAHSNNCIISFDLNLNKLKKFGFLGAGNNQSNSPFGLCCRGDYLYVCDFSNRRIQILTLDFEYVNTIQIDGDYPRRVQLSETTIGVASNEATFCFDLKSRTLKYNHNYGTFNLNYIDSTFYGSNHQQKKCYFFDSDGNT